jgi:hypothetical protein
MMTIPPPAPARPDGSRSAPRLARTQGWVTSRDPSSSGRGRGESRRFKVVAALISASIVLFLFGGGGYLATRQLFFIGTNADGIVTLYRGLPYDFIVPFYEETYTSGLPASLVPADRRATLLNHDLRSQNAAIAVIRAAELGRLTTK